MPGYDEIYSRHAAAYDELVRHEDCHGNLARFLRGALDCDGRSVLEPGAGTGRVTALYQERAAAVHLADRSGHMLDAARARFATAGERIRYSICENLSLASLGGEYDRIVEGWSFGHTVTDGVAHLEETVDALVLGCRSLLRPGGTVILLETLGSGATAPAPPNPVLARFYARLEEQHGFGRTTLATDYRFDNPEEAARICGFFFGEAFGARVRAAGSAIVPEFTGAWVKRD